jgi:hypothetical protein
MAVEAGAAFITLLLQHTTHLTVYDRDFLSCSALNTALGSRTIDVIDPFIDWYERSDAEFPYRKATHMLLDARAEHAVLEIMNRNII